MRFKKIFTIALCTSLLATSMPAFASENTTTVKNNEINTIQANKLLDNKHLDCFDSKKEKDLLIKTQGRDSVKLEPGDNPVTITFDDESKITYELKKINLSNKKTISARASTDHNGATDGYIATKTYSYAIASAKVNLYVYTKYPSRAVEIVDTDVNCDSSMSTITVGTPVVKKPYAREPLRGDCYVTGSWVVENSITGVIHSESIKVGCRVDTTHGFYLY